MDGWHWGSVGWFFWAGGGRRRRRRRRQMQEGEEEEEEGEEEKESEHESAALRLNIVCLDTMLSATQLPSLLKIRAAACSASTYRRSGEDMDSNREDMNSNKDAWSLSFIFDESLKFMDHLQQCTIQSCKTFKKIMKSFLLLKKNNHALLNAMMY